jgi:hypothetical protein
MPTIRENSTDDDTADGGHMETFKITHPISGFPPIIPVPANCDDIIIIIGH